MGPLHGRNDSMEGMIAKMDERYNRISCMEFQDWLVSFTTENVHEGICASHEFSRAV